MIEGQKYDAGKARFDLLRIDQLLAAAEYAERFVQKLQALPEREEVPSNLPTPTRLDLVPQEALEQVARVLGYGANKYAPDNWKKVERSRVRYFNAAMRHITKWWLGEKDDIESGLPHLAHATCCLLFLLYKDVHEPGV